MVDVQVVGRNPLGGIMVIVDGTPQTVPPSSHLLQGTGYYNTPTPTQSTNPFAPGYIQPTPQQQFQTAVANAPLIAPVSPPLQPIISSTQSANPFAPSYVPQTPQEQFNTAVLAAPSAASQELIVQEKANRPETTLSYSLYHPLESAQAIASYAVSPLLGVSREKIVEQEHLKRSEWVKGMVKEGPIQGIAKQSLFSGIEYGLITLPFGKISGFIGGKIASPTIRLGLKSLGLGVGAGLTAIGTSESYKGAVTAKATGEATGVYQFTGGLGMTGLGIGITKAVWNMPIIQPQKSIKVEFVGLSREEINAKGTIIGGEGYKTTQSELKGFQTMLRKEEVALIFEKGEVVKETPTFVVKEFEGMRGYFYKTPTGLPASEGELVDILGKERESFGKFPGVDVGIKESAGFPVGQPEEKGFKITMGKPNEYITKTPLAKTFQTSVFREDTETALSRTVVNIEKTLPQPKVQNVPITLGLLQKQTLKPIEKTMVPVSISIKPPKTKEIMTPISMPKNFEGLKNLQNPIQKNFAPSVNTLTTPSEMTTPIEKPLELPKQSFNQPEALKYTSMETFKQPLPTSTVVPPSQIPLMSLGGSMPEGGFKFQSFGSVFKSKQKTRYQPSLGGVFKFVKPVRKAPTKSFTGIEMRPMVIGKTGRLDMMAKNLAEAKGFKFGKGFGKSKGPGIIKPPKSKSMFKKLGSFNWKKMKFGRFKI